MKMFSRKGKWNFCLFFKRYLIKATLILMPFYSFGQSGDCHIKISFEGFKVDGREMDLSINDSTQVAVVSNGSVEFNTHLLKPGYASLTLRHASHGIPYSAFEHKDIYVQPGNIDIISSIPDSLMFAKVSGAPLSVLYDEKLLIPVVRCQIENTKIEVALKKARENGTSDTAQLNSQVVENIRSCFSVPQVFIKKNPGSPLLMVALQMLGTGDDEIGLTDKDVEAIYNSFPFATKNTQDGLAYAKQLEIEKENQHGMSDGPYVFYNNRTVIVKSVLATDTAVKAVIDSFPATLKTKTLLQVHVNRHPEWDFTVWLKAADHSSGPEFTASDKILVLSDIEGEFEPFRNLLLAAKIIDKKYNWTFGKGQLVVAGDLFDRGRQVNPFLWLLYKLEDEARAKGGDVHVILGNHDIMNLDGDFRYVEPVYIADAKLLNQNYADLYGANTELGQWLRSKNIIEKIADLLVLHGGVSPDILVKKKSLSVINTICRPFYGTPPVKVPDSLKDYFNDKALFWYRGYFVKPKATQGLVDSTLAYYHCKKIIVGHDIIDHIVPLYQNEVIGVDVNQHEGKHEALLIDKNIYYRIDDKGKKTLLLTN
jgi:Calcineurin-like phosphoesterase